MKILSALAARLMDVSDGLFDAFASLRRVLLRGVFRPDARDYRGSHFARLEPAEVLTQTIAVNAEDAVQARRVVALDQERYLPLADGAALFDVAGPLPGDGAPRSRPEQDFLLGIARAEALEQRRAEGGKAKACEAFVFEPVEPAGFALVFRDSVGDRKRRSRRLALAIAVAALAWTGADAWSAWRERLDADVAAAESEEMAAQRGVRQTLKQLAETRAAVAALDDRSTQDIGDVSDKLATLARRLPADAELSLVEMKGGRLRIEGLAATPASLELELRRTYEGSRVEFSSSQGEAPLRFEAVVREASNTARAAP